MNVNRGDFVTAKLKNEDGFSRQGIVISLLSDTTIKILGESGETYLCDSDAVFVPYKNLYGSTKQFYDNWHRKNRGEFKQ